MLFASWNELSFFITNNPPYSVYTDYNSFKNFYRDISCRPNQNNKSYNTSRYKEENVANKTADKSQKAIKAKPVYNSSLSKYLFSDLIYFQKLNDYNNRKNK